MVQIALKDKKFQGKEEFGPLPIIFGNYCCMEKQFLNSLQTYKWFACFQPSPYICLQADRVRESCQRHIYILMGLFSSLWASPVLDKVRDLRAHHQCGARWAPRTVSFRHFEECLFSKTNGEFVPPDFISFRNQEETVSSWLQATVQKSSKSSHKLGRQKETVVLFTEYCLI